MVSYGPGRNEVCGEIQMEIEERLSIQLKLTRTITSNTLLKIMLTCAVLGIINAAAAQVNPPWESPLHPQTPATSSERPAPSVAGSQGSHDTPNIPQPSVPPAPGILNPDFQPRCQYKTGEFECSNFAGQYCKDFKPSGNCFILVFCGLTSNPGFEPGKPCHALNLTRVRLENDSGFLYCAVEPQANAIVEDSCWITFDNTFDNEILKEALCKAYKDAFKPATTVSCPLPPLDPRFVDAFDADSDQPLFVEPKDWPRSKKFEFLFGSLPAGPKKSVGLAPIAVN